MYCSASLIFMLIKLLRKCFKEFLYFVLCEAYHEARKLKSAYKPNDSLGRSYPWKWPGVFLLNPGRDASPSQGPPLYSIKFASTHLYN